MIHRAFSTRACALGPHKQPHVLPLFFAHASALREFTFHQYFTADGISLQWFRAMGTPTSIDRVRQCRGDMTRPLLLVLDGHTVDAPVVAALRSRCSDSLQSRCAGSGSEGARLSSHRLVCDDESIDMESGLCCRGRLGLVAGLGAQRDGYP
ncbi:hypothetical protein FB451DRAFT_1228080, partial [Mycena latifolia]